MLLWVTFLACGTHGMDHELLDWVMRTTGRLFYTCKQAALVNHVRLFVARTRSTRSQREAPRSWWFSLSFIAGYLRA